MVVALTIGVLFGTFLIATLLGFPIFFNFLLGALAAIAVDPRLTMDVAMSPLYYSLNNFPLLAIPLFMYSGDLMVHSTLAGRLVALAALVVKRLPGKLGAISTVASAMYGAVCGSGPATAAAVGAMVEPDMRKDGYPVGYTAAVISAAGVLGMLIPPSVPAILFGFGTGISISDLFLTILLPGILMMLLFLVWNSYMAGMGRLGNVDRADASLLNSNSGQRQIIKDGLWAMGMPVIILGGIYSGIFTPTEAAAVACVYVMIVGSFVYHTLNWSSLIEVTRKSAYSILTLMLGLAFIGVFTRIVVLENVSEVLLTAVTSLTSSPVGILLLINLYLLIQGMFIDPLAGVLLVGPLLYPLCVEYIGMDPLQYGTMVVTVLALGVTTPPLSINIFIAMRQTGATLPQVLKYVGPFIVIGVVVALAVTFVPWLSLALVQ